MMASSDNSFTFNMAIMVSKDLFNGLSDIVGDCN